MIIFILQLIFLSFSRFFDCGQICGKENIHDYSQMTVNFLLKIAILMD